MDENNHREHGRDNDQTPLAALKAPPVARTDV
jgi:hypothetical protein